jgi:hypothetical protein
VHQYSLLFHSVAWQPGQRPITAAVCFVYLESLLCNPEFEFGSCQEISVATHRGGQEGGGAERRQERRLGRRQVEGGGADGSTKKRS